jgi:hypothetical protein
MSAFRFYPCDHSASVLAELFVVALVCVWVGVFVVCVCVDVHVCVPPFSKSCSSVVVEPMVVAAGMFRG